MRATLRPKYVRRRMSALRATGAYLRKRYVPKGKMLALPCVPAIILAANPCRPALVAIKLLQSRTATGLQSRLRHPRPLLPTSLSKTPHLSILQGRAISEEIDCLCASDSCHVMHYCGDANCVKPSGSQRVACVNAQISILSRPRAVEAFVTILEDGKTACAFSTFCFPDTEGQNCLEKQIDAGGTECRPIGRIASWTDGLSDMEFVSSTGGSEYTCHLFFAQVMEREV